MRVDSSFADKCDGNTDCAPKKGSTPANAVEEERNEDKVGEWADTIVDTGNEEVSTTRNAKIVVHNGLVVANDVDSTLVSQDGIYESRHFESYPVI